MHPPDAALGLEDPRLQDDFPQTAGVLIIGRINSTVVAPRDDSRHLSRVATNGTGVCTNLLTTKEVAKEETKVAVEAQVAEEAITPSAPINDTFESIVAKLSASKDNKTYRGLKVRNVIVNLDDEELPRITLVVNSDIDGFVEKDGAYVAGKTHNVFTSAFALAAVLKENEETAMMANYIVRNPKVAETLFSGSMINLIQVPVKANAEYVNPFTTKADADAYVSDHDWISNLVVAVKLGTVGNKVIDRLIDRMVDGMM